MAEAEKPIKDTGLRGVKVASTRICQVIGDQGKLIYRGYLINDLAKRASYEEVAYLMLYEKLPTESELAAFNDRLIGERAVARELLDALRTRPSHSLPMDILQAAVAMMANHHDHPDRLERGNAADMGVALIAKLATVVAAWNRIRGGHPPIDPDPSLGHAANFLYMLTGKAPDDEIAHMMDVILVLHAEHSFNASTFTARQIASTRAHLFAAIAGAIGSLSGELHGGANERVMQMLFEIGSIDAIDAYLDRKFASDGKIMGMGHAVYKTKDPRAIILEPMVKKMGDRVHDSKWYDIAVTFEQKAVRAFRERKGIDIYANVDFYSGPLYYYMGIPVDLFTPVFAVSRIAGWVAHVIEEQFAEAAPKPVLYRPSAEYVGEYCGPEECAFVPLDRR